MQFKFYTQIKLVLLYLSTKSVAIETIIKGVASSDVLINALFLQRGAQDHHGRVQLTAYDFFQPQGI